MRVLVAMIGARAGYAVPRILHEAGLLARLETDFVSSGRAWTALEGLVPGVLRGDWMRRGFSRRPAGVPPDLCRHHPAFAARYALERRLLPPKDHLACHARAGRRMAQAALEGGLRGVDAIYTYNTAGLELMRPAARRGIRCVMEQTIAPMAVERRLLAPEYERLGLDGPAHTENAGARAMMARERAEWQTADVIACGSEFVRRSIGAVGGPIEKCVVVPYGVEGPERHRPERAGPRRRVLFAGQVGIRKGAHILAEAARRLARHPIEIRMVGVVKLPRAIIDRFPANVRVVGAVPRPEMEAHFQWADVLCLPSFCEGSALVTYEAMSRGLPVVTTENTGSLVRDGENGLLVPVGNAEALAEALVSAQTHPFPGLQRDARVDPPDWSFEAYRHRLLRLVRGGAREEDGL